MESLRRAKRLGQFILIWFGLTLGAALASPRLQPQGQDLICSANGSAKAPSGTDGGTVPHAHTLDCPSCLGVMVAPLLPSVALPQPSPLAHALQPVAAAHIASVTAPPLPSRGPPHIS